jgi:glycosyltransferase involved in cell wall biosynthesis
MLSCFFPAFNEEPNISHVVQEALEVLPRYADRIEVIVVDDGSEDGTADVVRALAADHPEVRLEQHPRNLGYGHALQTGLRTAKGDAVFFTDGDRQFSVADIGRLLDRFDEADLVAGYRIERSDPWHRLVVARVYHVVLRLVFGLRVHDVDCAFKLLRRRVLDAVLDDLVSRSAFISPELLIRAKQAGFEVTEVPIPHHPRVAGTPGGATPKVIARTLVEIVRMRRRLGASGRGRSIAGRR